MKNVLAKVSLALPMLLLSGYGFSGEPLPSPSKEQTPPAQQPIPSKDQAPSAQQPSPFGQKPAQPSQKQLGQPIAQQAGQPVTQQVGQQSAQPTQEQATMIQQVLDQSSGVIVRVPLDQSMQQMQDQAEVRVVTSSPLQLSDNFDCSSMWDSSLTGQEQFGGDTQISARIGFLFPFFRWGISIGSPYIYNSSYYGTHYPYYNYYGRPYYYDRPSHYSRYNNYDYYYYGRRW